MCQSGEILCDHPVHVLAAQARHPQVEQHEVIVVGGELLQRRPPAGGVLDDVPILGEHARHQVHEVDLIVHQQHSGTGRGAEGIVLRGDGASAGGVS